MLVKTQELIHSKMSGQGRCESHAEREALLQKIRAFIEAQE
jgi:hypothetical protein